MTTYTVHIQTSGPTARMVLVKEGFNWAAALFGALWALVLGLWEVAGFLVAVALALGGLISWALPVSAQVAANVGVFVLVGLAASELRNWTLARRGFDEDGVVIAPNVSEAERRYLEAHPDMVARMEQNQ